MKRIIVAMSVLLSLHAFLFAHGKGDITERSVNQEQSWREVFDLTDKKEGKYNVLVRVEDQGGNVAQGGPFNIWVDPESDLPVAGITNPLPKMRVTGNLNIVGTCVDDDSVDHVNLILDDNKSDVRIAEGKEFWSYYLDTSNMEEGPHTIEVFGTDVNGLRGHSVTLMWNLDRRRPVTEVTNIGMGTLVSGKINLIGTVQDGNGIKSLSYSVDGGNSFTDVKLSLNKETGVCEFHIPVNTKDIKDGPSVCWFKAQDKMGSIGVYSFLYFIDNTEPEVQVVYPSKDDKVNGKFSVVGYAKDTIGIERLTWSVNDQSGDFELIPGNAYWAKDFDYSKAEKAGSFDLNITATDTAGNVVTVKQTIRYDPELDKPLLTIDYPADKQAVDGDAGLFFVRGIAHDDDGIATVVYSLDGGPEQTIEAQGVFYALHPNTENLTGGEHTLTAWAVDENGIKGNPVTSRFIVKGNMPEIGDIKLHSIDGDTDIYQGYEVNPESDASLVTTLSSDAGIMSASYKMEWGTKGLYENEIPMPSKNGAKTVPVSISLDDAPWGLVRITITARDIFDRAVEKKLLLNMTDLTRVKSDTPQVVFTDSRISDAGDIINDLRNPVTGYFIGGVAKSVRLVPKTKFATVEVKDNVIYLYGTEELGNSEPVKVRVTTDQGLTYDSRELIFHSGAPAPHVQITSVNGMEPNYHSFMDGNEPIHIEGQVTSETPLSRFSYRVLTANADVNSDFVQGVEALPVSYAEYNVEKVAKDGTFSFDVDPFFFVRGCYVVEVIAENGRQAADAIFVRKLPPLPARSIDGSKAAVANPPVISWFDGVNLYYVTTYQGIIQKDHLCGVFRRDDMTPGAHTFDIAGKTLDTGKAYSSSFTTRKDGGVSVFFKSVNDTPYASGMKLVLPRGSRGQAQLVADIELISSEFPITAVTYEITGDKTAGGDVTQTGKASKVRVASEDGLHYEAVIPLDNLPARNTKIKVIADTAKGSGSYEGSIIIVRERDRELIDNSRQFYWTPQENVIFNEKTSSYALASGTSFSGYANVPAPITSSFASAPDGLELSSDGNNVSILAVKEGLYRNVTVKIKDGQGVDYTSQPVTLLVDNENPHVAILSPAQQSWLQDSLTLEVEADDTNGIASVEYSLDHGETWNAFTRRGSGGANTYAATIKLDLVEDGLLSVNVRATDRAGRTTIVGGAYQKDTQPPEAFVIVPGMEDIINGENLIAFKVTDNGRMDHITYLAPPAGKVAPQPIDIPLAPIVTTHVGTVEKPLHDLMTFNFYDAAGNVLVMREWQFIIDNQSDLPVAEVHLPEEEAVVTKDFTVSGVVYDDDGPSKIWYKIDKNDYQSLPDYASSFTFDVPIEGLADNEHTITVYAEDSNGVKGPEFVRHFNVSLEEPKGNIVKPSINTTVKETITIDGKASDKNGIKMVYVSLDNGNSYDETIGDFGHDKLNTEWHFTVDTRVIQDGTHAVFFKIVDWYGIEALYSSLINIDNTVPEITLELPMDGSLSTGMVFFSGQTTDNVELTDLHITVTSLEGKTVNSALSRKDLEVGQIITEAIDLSQLDNGLYNIELVGSDAANNVTRVSRNIMLNKFAPKAKVDLLYPLNGEEVRGVFNIYGTASSEVEITSLILYVDAVQVQETLLSTSGYYKFQLSPDLITDGQHKIRVQAVLADGKKITSNEQYINYTSFGPWITIDNFTYGDFAVDRPYIRGNSGYSISEEELVAAKVKGASKDLKAAVEAKSVEKVELSLDNGRTFEKISSSGKWRYRVENKDISEGYHFLLVRATMKNGEVAVTRTIVQVDNTAPIIKLISPGAGGRYNQELVFSGLTHDNVELKDVTLYLRKGDKASYEVPKFIQGLYFDWHFWGATLFDIGVGLTFFDDNVKLQVQWGQFTETQWALFKSGKYRYGGDSIIGAKLLANVYYLPFRYLFGPDWEWLSMNIALGANFTRFNDSGSGSAQILSAALAQLEFPRVTFAKQKMFRTIAFYTEGQLWFVPSDVAGDNIATIVPQISFGLRVNVF